MNNSSNPTSAAKRLYTIRFWIAMTAYAIVVVASIRALDQGVTGPWRIVLALTPLLPVAVVFASFIQFMQNIDELERQIHLESLAIAAGATALLSITYGFLEVARLPHVSAWCTYSVVMIAWLIATPIVARKYR